MTGELLVVRNLKKYFTVKEGLRKTRTLKAVDDVSFTLERGRTLGLIGESGSGKTTLGKTVIRLYTPTSGKILFDGDDITFLPRKELRRYRKRMQIVYQDPYSSLNPRMRIKDVIGRPMKIHKLVSSERELVDSVKRLLEEVGLPSDVINRYPHELSGGQRQRVAIARALATEPDLIVLDEPTSALDVSVQAQILDLLKRIQRKRKTSYIFISHDIAVVNYMSDYIAVMYMGMVVESGPSEDLISNPLHPYTRMLIGVIPRPDPRNRIEVSSEDLGEPKLPLDPPPICRYHDRCKSRLPVCGARMPPEIRVRGDRIVRCWLYSEKQETRTTPPRR
ncbi:MAG: ABC transporter ATP-binding protein [Desulfurococcales archaeon]|nr:ABC transporter ATP-binding protein [Desulfurococcales archaeon]